MMRNRKLVALFLTLALSFTSISCAKKEEPQKPMKPQVAQMKSICELATMECYYHNVAKFTEEDAQGFWFWKKDKHFWIEYSGIVKIGIDASLLGIEVKEDSVTITIPNAKVLGEKVDQASLTEASFIVEQDSADVSAKDQTKAFAAAQDNMVKAASEDATLLASAQQRAQTLLEEYVNNIGAAVGKEYFIEWKYIKQEEQAPISDEEEKSESKGD